MSANYPRLCGGTFFCLLIRAVKNHARSDATASHGFVGYTQPELLKGLLKALYLGEFYRANSTLESEATHFKHCENISAITKCETQVLIDFDYDVREGASKSSVVLSEIVEHFLDDPQSEDNNQVKKERLVRSLLQLIREDESISDEQEFFVRKYGGSLTKQELSETVDFQLSTFLLGIWHYCMTKVRNNEVGRATYRAWFPNGEKDIVSSIGLDNRIVNLIPPKAQIERGENKRASKGQAETKQPSEESLYYMPYFKAVSSSIGRVNTILRSEAYDFTEFYVPMGLGAIADFYQDNYYPYELISEPNVERLNKITRCLMIQATGGMGKSMLMRHLMFDGIKSCEKNGRIPVFINLKNYKSSNYDITQFIYDEIKKLFPGLETSRFNLDLAKEKYILLLDGLDEISPVYRGQFLNRLYSFLSLYRNLQTILSTRPFSEDIPTSMFRVLGLCPLSKEQAIELVKKIEYMPDIPNLKEDFIRALDENLYRSYNSFARIPLLLTFMLIKFCEDGRMPEKKTDFYEEVFDVLATRHDSKKVGYSRRVACGLSHERLKDIFSAFCGETYQENELSFLRSQLIAHFEKLIAKMRTEEERQTSPEKLLEDLVSGVCMLYKDGERYYFVHRSFQEYFCARVFSKQKPEKLKDIGKFFVYQEVNPNDMTFDFLYELIPEHVEEYIFIPFLEELLDNCENRKGYWSYLESYYPDFTYEYFDYGKRGQVAYYSASDSFLLNYLIDKYRIIENSEIPDFTRFKDFIEEEYVLMQAEGETIIVSLSEARDIYNQVDKLDEFELNPPKVSGYTVGISFGEIYEEKESWPELIEMIENDRFRYKMEYNGLKRILREMKDRKENQTADLIEII